jgi:hypothetical protein
MNNMESERKWSNLNTSEKEGAERTSRALKQTAIKLDNYVRYMAYCDEQGVIVKDAPDMSNIGSLSVKEIESLAEKGMIAVNNHLTREQVTEANKRMESFE